MRQLLFSIDRLEFIGNGLVLIGGRCCADLMRKGDVAGLMVFRENTGIFVNAEPVLITFPEFEFYGKNVEEIHPGCTAGIRIPSTSAIGLRIGWFLKGENI